MLFKPIDNSTMNSFSFSLLLLVYQISGDDHRNINNFKDKKNSEDSHLMYDKLHSDESLL